MFSVKTTAWENNIAKYVNYYMHLFDLLQICKELSICKMHIIQALLSINKFNKIKFKKALRTSRSWVTSSEVLHFQLLKIAFEHTE